MSCTHTQTTGILRGLGHLPACSAPQSVPEPPGLAVGAFLEAQRPALRRGANSTIYSRSWGFFCQSPRGVWIQRATEGEPQRHVPPTPSHCGPEGRSRGPGTRRGLFCISRQRAPSVIEADRDKSARHRGKAGAPAWAGGKGQGAAAHRHTAPLLQALVASLRHCRGPRLPLGGFLIACHEGRLAVRGTRVGAV